MLFGPVLRPAERAASNAPKPIKTDAWRHPSPTRVPHQIGKCKVGVRRILLLKPLARGNVRAGFACLASESPPSGSTPSRRRK